MQLSTVVAHIPLNLAAATLASHAPALPPVAVGVVVPLLVGASAGLCEETARVIALWRRRTVREAVVTGLGHGGVRR